MTEKFFTRNLSRALIDDIAGVFGAVYRLMELATEQEDSEE